MRSCAITSWVHAKQDYRRLCVAWEELPFNASAQILLQLFQTSRTNRIGRRAKAAASTWARLINPRLPRLLHDDATAARFIKEFFGGDVDAVFQALPVGVMKADFWRYAILFAFGGIYSDIDTRCLRPVKHWFPPRPPTAADKQALSPGSWPSAGALAAHTQHNNLSWHDCSIVLALENDASICQWTLASVPGHPILRQMIQMMVKAVIAKGFLTGKPHYYDNMVHDLTGPSHFTRAVAVAMQLPPDTNAAGIAKAAWTDKATYERFRQQRVCIVADYFFGGDRAQNVVNEYGSQSYHDGTYPRWLEEVDRFKNASLART